jgi:hypothetical protein
VMLDQITLNQIQITAIGAHDLSPLLTHPNFRQGVTDARERFLSDYAPAPLSEDEMIYEVEICLGRDSVEQSKETSLYWLGYAYGTINEGLTFASPTTDTQDDLFALLTHPEFLQGVDDAVTGFHYEYEEAPLALDEMITLVEVNLSRAATQEGHEMFDGTELEGLLTYFYCLGSVFGTINYGLTFRTIGR